MLVAIFAAVQL